MTVDLEDVHAALETLRACILRREALRANAERLLKRPVMEDKPDKILAASLMCVQVLAQMRPEHSETCVGQKLAWSCNCSAGLAIRMRDQALAEFVTAVEE